MLEGPGPGRAAFDAPCAELLQQAQFLVPRLLEGGFLGHADQGLEAGREGGQVELADVLAVRMQPGGQGGVEVTEVLGHDPDAVTADDDGRERVVEVPAAADRHHGEAVGADFRPGKRRA